jgi:mRNA-degrading endonuclease RelE of RelBE toxin-antitoxin system
MIAVDLTPRFRREAERLSIEERAQVESALRKLSEAFGDAHAHAGLGIRKLRRNLFECRAALNLRIIFFVEKGRCLCFGIGDHDYVRKLLRSL